MIDSLGKLFQVEHKSLIYPLTTFNNNEGKFSVNFQDYKRRLDGVKCEITCQECKKNEL